MFGDSSSGSSTLSLSWSELSSMYGFAGGTTQTVGVQVTDDQFESSIATIDVTVAAGSPPVAILVDGSTGTNPTTINVNDTLNLDASSSYDPDGGMIYYEWDLNGDGMFGDGSSGSSSLSLSWGELSSMYGFAGGTTQTVAVQVTDDQFESSIATIDVTVAAGSPPVAILVDGSTGTNPTTMNVNGTLNLDASSSYDPDGGMIYYE